MERARAGLPEFPPGLHLTHCLGCPRQSYYELTQKQPPSDKMVHYNIIGNLFQEKFLEHNDKLLILKVGDFDIICTPDSINETCEFKSTRKCISTALQEEWIQQSAVYCYLLGVTEYNLDTYQIASCPLYKSMTQALYAPERGEESAPVLLSYTLNFKKDEILEIVRYVRERAAMIIKAILLEDEELAIRDSGDRGWRCRDCAYNEICSGFY